MMAVAKHSWLNNRSHDPVRSTVRVKKRLPRLERRAEQIRKIRLDATAKRQKMQRRTQAEEKDAEGRMGTEG